MFYRRSGKRSRSTLPPGLTPSEASRAELRSLAGIDPPPGLIGYQGAVPVGWISLGPREDYAKLQRSPVMKPVDELPVWSVVCFVVPSEHRRQGVAKALLAGAVEYARNRGVSFLEAYTSDIPYRIADDWLWFGTKSIYDAAGFEEVARRRPARPVVRLRLAKE
jgi:GNAT superfamily N-acetyltransferase